MKKKGNTKKTTAADEKAAREARAAKKGAGKSKAAREALETAEALSGGQAPAAEAKAPKAAGESREAELRRAAEMGVELADNEFLTEPQGLPEGARVKKIVKRDGKKLQSPIYQVVEPQAQIAQSTAAAKKGGRKSERSDSARKGWDKISVQGERAQTVLKKLEKGTRERPVLAAKQLSDQERHIARGLFAQGLIGRDKFEQGIGYFAK